MIKKKGPTTTGSQTKVQKPGKREQASYRSPNVGTAGAGPVATCRARASGKRPAHTARRGSLCRLAYSTRAHARMNDSLSKVPAASKVWVR